MRNSFDQINVAGLKSLCCGHVHYSSIISWTEFEICDSIATWHSFKFLLSFDVIHESLNCSLLPVAVDYNVTLIMIQCNHYSAISKDMKEGFTQAKGVPRMSFMKGNH